MAGVWAAGGGDVQGSDCVASEQGARLLGGRWVWSKQACAGAYGVTWLGPGWITGMVDQDWPWPWERQRSRGRRHLVACVGPEWRLTSEPRLDADSDRVGGGP